MQFDLAELRATLISRFPELSDAHFTTHTAGWDSIAVDADDRWIFKFPRHADAARRLRTEAGLLAVVRPHVTMALPDLKIVEGSRPFSRHIKLQGEHLLAAQYERLQARSRERLVAEVAQFFAELHALDRTGLERAGATAIGSWLPPDEILREAWPLLPAHLHGYATRAIAAWQDLGDDPLGTTFGHFDTHGWNTAFDHAQERLNGVFDFGDSGFGDLHKEFIQPSWISPDFVESLVAAYARLTGHSIDLWRVALISGALRISELGGLANDEAAAGAMVKSIEAWAGRHPAP